MATASWRPPEEPASSSTGSLSMVRSSRSGGAPSTRMSGPRTVPLRKVGPVHTSRVTVQYSSATSTGVPRWYAVHDSFWRRWFRLSRRRTRPARRGRRWPFRWSGEYRRSSGAGYRRSRPGTVRTVSSRPDMGASTMDLPAGSLPMPIRSTEHALFRHRRAVTNSETVIRSTRL